MLKLSLLVRLEAKKGKEEEVAAFLMKGLELANQEAGTPVWFALRIGPSTFGLCPAADLTSQNGLSCSGISCFLFEELEGGRLGSDSFGNPSGLI